MYETDIRIVSIVCMGKRGNRKISDVNKRSNWDS